MPPTYSSPLHVLRIRPFAAYWTASVASNIGTWLQRIVAMVLVWELTRSPLAVGLLAAAATVPVLLFSLVAGYVSDRFDRRRTIIVAHLISAGAAAALAAYTAASGRSPAAPIAVAFILASCWAFAKPALSSYFPSLVPPEALRAATAANSLNFIVGQVVGPIVATVFVAADELALAFLVNAGTFLVPAIVVSRLPPARREAHDREPPRLTLAALREALPRANLALLGIVALAAGASDVLRNLAPVVVDAVGAEQGFTGVVVTAVSLGSGLGALTTGFVASRLGEARGVTGALLLEGSALLLLAIWFQPLTVVAAALAAGCGYTWAFVLLTSELQTRTPDGLRGRVMSMHSLAHLGMRPATTLATSAIAASLGAVIALVANGFLALAAIGLVGASLIGRRRPGATSSASSAAPMPAEGPSG